jgi:hypothetical protein
MRSASTVQYPQLQASEESQGLLLFRRTSVHVKRRNTTGNVHNLYCDATYIAVSIATMSDLLYLPLKIILIGLDLLVSECMQHVGALSFVNSQLSS